MSAMQKAYYAFNHTYHHKRKMTCTTATHTTARGSAHCPCPCESHSSCCTSDCLQFPYYTFINRQKMYSIGSLFYAIYFFVSFPMFMRIDEDPAVKRWTLGEVSSTLHVLPSSQHAALVP
eukprot:GHUV01017981.1.p1 GENE.GHUV01017981.1~~GHUV01017981.1.p1  ORF type:complete len:120 (-),score=14.78 GHUV01017981.1:89-448(-)